MILSRELARVAGDVDRRRMSNSVQVEPAAEIASFCKVWAGAGDGAGILAALGRRRWRSRPDKT